MLSNKSLTVPDVADLLERPAYTVRFWIRSWNKERISSIFPRYKNNQNAAKLTKKQKKEIEETLGKSPETSGLSGAFWSLPTIKHYLRAEFGVVYESNRSYHYILKYSGYSWKLPSPFDIRRDDKYVKERMKQIRAETRSYMKNDDWVVLVADETRINWEEEVRRAWLKRGKKTVIKLKRNKIGQSYFGALNLSTGKEHIIPLEWQDTENMVMALERIREIYPNKCICLLWDNAGWHKSKALREKLQTGESLSKFHLINFPPYAPDENPEEHVWKYGKEKIANRHFDAFDAMKVVFTKLLNGKIFDYKM